MEAWCSTALLRFLDDSRDLRGDPLRRCRLSSDEEPPPGRSIPSGSVAVLRLRVSPRDALGAWSRASRVLESRLLSRSERLLPSRCRVRRSRRWRGVSWADDSTPTSRKLISRACSNIWRSKRSNRRSSGDLTGFCMRGSTSSPCLYFSCISRSSASGRALSGCARRNISSRVATVALCRVSRTWARHEGQVATMVPADGGLGEFSAVVACQLNQSLRQDPQNVCRQSRRVRG